MDFAIKAILSFIVGGSFVSLVIWISEHSGPTIGGAIAGIPQTILISLASICLTEGSVATKIASNVIPVILLASILYAYTFIQSARSIDGKNKHLLAILLAMFVWLVAALIIHFIFHTSNIIVTSITGIFGIMIAHFIFKGWRSANPKSLKRSRHIYIVRFFISGAVVLAAVLAAKLLGPLWGGVISGFPATFSTSLYFLNKSQGCKFTEGFAKRLPLATISTLIFAVILNITVTKIQPAYSFGLGIFGSLVYTYILLNLTKPKTIEQID
ncbi:MAG: DUF3147 family protein [Candidatus Saccharimonadales bacterium]